MSHGTDLIACCVKDPTAKESIVTKLARKAEVVGLDVIILASEGRD
jgi:hypothetical protein